MATECPREGNGGRADADIYVFFKRISVACGHKPDL
jgi:hypothetical protein